MQDINAILERIRSTDDRVAINDFMRLMADFIYRFPKIRRKDRIVESGEFYLYVSSKLSDGSRLKKYDLTKGLFNVWFTKVLDNFLNTLVTAKIKEREKLPLAEIDVDTIGIDNTSQTELISFKKEKQNVADAYSLLNDTEKAVAICSVIFYRDISPEELKFLSEFIRKDYDVVSGEIESLLTGELQDEDHRIKLESEKISSLYFSIQDIESKIAEFRTRLENSEVNGSIDEELNILIEKLEFTLWKKRTKYIQYTQIHKRGQGLVLLKNKSIAKFLNLKEGTITSAMTRIRQKIREQN
jgi:hypothetical protein